MTKRTPDDLRAVASILAAASNIVRVCNHNFLGAVFHEEVPVELFDLVEADADHIKRSVRRQRMSRRKKR